MSLLLQLAAVALVALIVRSAWLAGRPRRWFRIKVRRGEPVAVFGKVAPSFLAAVREVARRHGLASGSVEGVERAVGVGLEFSRHFSPEARQQVRNAWGYSGWKAARPPGRRGRA